MEGEPARRGGERAAAAAQVAGEGELPAAAPPRPSLLERRRKAARPGPIRVERPPPPVFEVCADLREAAVEVGGDEPCSGAAFEAVCDGCGRRADEAVPADAPLRSERTEAWEEDLERCPDCGRAACGECRTDVERGLCACPSSNFGHAYADMEPMPFFGACGGGGARYEGPFKGAAQVRAENRLFQHLYSSLRKTGGDGVAAARDMAEMAALCEACGARGAALRCGACLCERYCSQAHRAARAAAHAAECRPFLPPSEAPAVSVDQRDPVFRSALRLFLGQPELRWPNEGEWAAESRFCYKI